MELQATLTTIDLRNLIEPALPLDVDIDGDQGERVFTLQELVGVEFVPQRGIRLSLTGKISWPILGVTVPITLKSIEVLISVAREERPSAHLVLRFVIEKADFAWIPGVVDGAIADRINAEIQARKFELPWDFEKLMTHRFPLPVAVTSAQALSLFVPASSLHITDRQLELRVTLSTHVERGAEAAASEMQPTLPSGSGVARSA